MCVGEGNVLIVLCKLHVTIKALDAIHVTTGKRNERPALVHVVVSQSLEKKEIDNTTSRIWCSAILLLNFSLAAVESS